MPRYRCEQPQTHGNPGVSCDSVSARAADPPGISLNAMTESRFSSDVYARRLAAAARAAADAGLAGLVITPGYDLRYLVGSRAQTFERLTALVLPADRATRRSWCRGWSWRRSRSPR